VAYEVYVENPKAVIIFLSGIHNPSVTAFFGHARMLLDEGYASILLEMRAHGESEGDVIALGFKEHRDTRAVVDYIRANPRYAETPIVVYGLSMGGAVAINSIGQISDIDALISLSAYSAWDDVFWTIWGRRDSWPLCSGPSSGSTRGSSTAGPIAPSTRKTKSKNWATGPHSYPLAGDTQVPYANFERLVSHAPAHVETWVREGDLHFIVQEGLFLTPHEDTEYAERILGFLNGHFAP
jgi:uncharacterized protein